MMLPARRFSAFLMCLFAALLAGLPAARAEAGRIYFAGYLGINALADRNFSESTLGASGQIEFQPGKSFAGALGVRLMRGLRAEGEFSYLDNSLGGISFAGLGGYDLGGSLQSKLAMVNLYYEIPLGGRWKRVKPFVGAGVGYGWHEAKIDDVSGFALDMTEDTSGLVWQVGGGLELPLSDSASLIAAYRYVDGDDLDYDSYTIDYGTHEIRAGLSWALPFK